MRKTTVNQILNIDTIRGILQDIDAMAGDIEGMLIVTRDKQGGIKYRTLGSYPEILGLIELAHVTMIDKIDLNKE